MAPVDAPSLTRPSSPWTWRCVVQRLAGVGQQAAGAGQQGLADGGGAHLPARAREQRRAYLRLQVGHVQADGGRRQVQGARGVGEGAQVGDGDQVRSRSRLISA